MAIVEATDSEGNTETSEAGFMIKSYTLWIEQNWDKTYGLTDTVNITLKGFDQITNWLE